MRTTVLAILLAGVAMPAFAADMPLKAPYREAPVYNNWTGFYIGGHGGFGWGRFNNIDEAALVGSFTGDSFSEPRMRGFVAGIHGGYNWQVSQFLVLGIEGDYSFAGIKENQTLTLTPPLRGLDVTDSLHTKIDSLASIRGRLGFLATPSFLLYGTGGVAFAHTKVNVNSDAITTIAAPPIPVGTDLLSIDASNKTNWTGWAAGVGGEWMLMPNILLRVEYLHYDFGDKTVSIDGTVSAFRGVGVARATAPFSADVKTNLNADVVRGGLTFKF